MVFEFLVLHHLRCTNFSAAMLRHEPTSLPFCLILCHLQPECLRQFDALTGNSLANQNGAADGEVKHKKKPFGRKK